MSKNTKMEEKKKAHSSYVPLFFGVSFAVSIFVLLFAGVAVAVGATDYYVATWGSDVNSGTSLDDPWQHPSYAAEQAQAGDTIYLLDGTWYDEHVAFSNSGSEGRPITMKLHAGTPTLDGVDGTGEGIHIKDKSHIVVDGLTIKNYERGIRIHVSYGKYADDVTLKNNKISDMEANGINVLTIGAAFINNLAVLNNQITNVYNGTAIWSAKPNNAIIKGNTIDNCAKGIGFASYTKNTLVEDNYITNTTHSNTAYGIDFGMRSSDCTIRNNTLTNIKHRAVRLDYYCTNFLITGNIMKTWGESGYWIYAGSSGVFEANYNEGKGAGIIGSWQIIQNTFNDASLSFYEESETIRSKSLILKNNRFLGADSYLVLDGVDGAVVSNNFFVNSGYLGIRPGYRNANVPCENIIVSNNVFHNLPSDGIGIRRAYDSYGTIVKNITIKNNIFSGVCGYCVNNKVGEDVVIYYNDVWNCDLPYFNDEIDEVIVTKTVEQDPLFTDQPDDFHLKSKSGRWSGSGWISDAVDSPCVDAGDPADEYSNEPKPNGGRINLGAYGNTDESSRSVPTGPDTIPPYTSAHYPAKSATNISKDTNIIVHINDDGKGVDQTSIVMTVEGTTVTPTISGIPADYILTYDPSTDFDYDQVIDVTLDAQDLASPANVMSQDSFSFTISYDHLRIVLLISIMLRLLVAIVMMA